MPRMYLHHSGKALLTETSPSRAVNADAIARLFASQQDSLHHRWVDGKPSPSVEVRQLKATGVVKSADIALGKSNAEATAAARAQRDQLADHTRAVLKEIGGTAKSM